MSFLLGNLDLASLKRAKPARRPAPVAQPGTPSPDEKAKATATTTAPPSIVAPPNVVVPDAKPQTRAQGASNAKSAGGTKARKKDAAKPKPQASTRAAPPSKPAQAQPAATPAPAAPAPAARRLASKTTAADATTATPAPTSLALVPATPAAGGTGEGTGAGEIITSARRASRQIAKRLRGKRPPVEEKALECMTIREIIERSMRPDRSGKRRKRANATTTATAAAGSPAAPVPALTAGPNAERAAGTAGGAGPSSSGAPGMKQIAPQVRVNAQGEIVVNQDTLTLKSQGLQLMRPERRVEEHSTRVSAFSYSGYLTPEKWTVEDTEKFYQAVRQFGMDYSLIETLFPTRQRKQIKSKFKREERANPAKIEAALQAYGRGDCAANFEHMVNLLAKRKAAEEANVETAVDATINGNTQELAQPANA